MWPAQSARDVELSQRVRHASERCSPLCVFCGVLSGIVTVCFSGGRYNDLRVPACRALVSRWQRPESAANQSLSSFTSSHLYSWAQNPLHACRPVTNTRHASPPLSSATGLILLTPLSSTEGPSGASYHVRWLARATWNREDNACSLSDVVLCSRVDMPAGYRTPCAGLTVVLR